MQKFDSGDDYVIDSSGTESDQDSPKWDTDSSLDGPNVNISKKRKKKIPNVVKGLKNEQQSKFVPKASLLPSFVRKFSNQNLKKKSKNNVNFLYFTRLFF